MTTKLISSRRKFLATLGAGSAAAATVVMTRQSGKPAVTSQPAQGKGYQLTEHVRNYYRSTEV